MLLPFYPSSSSFRLLGVISLRNSWDWLFLVALGDIYTPPSELILDLLVGLLVGLLFGLLVGLVGRLFGRWFSRMLSKRPLVTPHQGLWHSARTSALVGLIFALFCGLIFGLIGYDKLDLLGGLCAGLIFVPFGWLVGQLLPGISDKRPLVTPRQGLWHSARASTLVGLIFGLLDWLAVGMVRGLVFGLIVGAIFGLVGWLFGQLLRRILDKRLLVAPHQGLWYFARHSVLVGLIFGLLGGLVFGLSKGLADGLISGLIRGLVVGLSSALVFGLVDWLVGRLANEMPDKPPLIAPHQNVWRAARRSVWAGLIFGLLGGLLLGLPDRPFDGLIGGLIFGLIFGLMSWSVCQFLSVVHDRHSVLADLVPGLLSGLLVGLLFGLAVGLFFGLITRSISGAVLGAIYGLIGWLLSSLIIGSTSQVETGTKLGRGNTWQRLVQIASLRNMLSFALVTTLLGLSEGVGLVTALVAGLIFGLVAWLFFGLLSGFVSGLSSRILDAHTLISPNQGIRQSARNSLRVGLIFGLIFGLISGLLTGLIFGQSSGQFFGLVFGVSVGLIIGTISALSVGLSNGASACIQHVILRLFLWRSGCIPWNYPQFLDYAAERILLRKVGGGYIFLHRLLLDYFANLGAEPVSAETAERAQETVSPVNVRASIPTILNTLADHSTSPFSPAPSDSSRLLPCGHEQRSNARFCSVCGAPVPS